MTRTNAALTATMADGEAAAPNGGGARFTVSTRFGEMSVDADAALHMPRGMLGFSEMREFVLVNLPEDRFGQFKLLQSLEAPDLSFIVAPYNMEDDAIAVADLAAGFEVLGVAEGDGAVLLVVSVRKLGEQVNVSVNLRAPLLLDTRNRLLWQHVLANPEYPVRHDLQPVPAAP